MPKKKNIIITISLFLLLIIGLNSMFIVEEGYQAITIQLGRIVNTYKNAGINFKTPFIDKAVIFPKKILTWNNKTKDIITIEGEYLHVKVTARWRIIDPVKFYEANTNIDGSYSKLDTLLDPKIKSTIAAYSRVEVIRSSNDMLDDGYKTSESKAISTGRALIAKKIKDEVQDSFRKQGIEIIDIIFKQVRFNDDLTQDVYDRMITSRDVIAKQYESEGEKEKNVIIGKTDKRVKEIQSEAKAYAQEKMGDADALAAKIYSEAYDVDPEFYSFWRALESYKETLPKFNKTFSTDMEYFQYLYSSK